jgi:hypothetical protein
MALSNYGELKSTTANWLSDDTLTARIPEFIALGESRIYSEPKLRIRQLEVTADVTITANTQTTALPTRYLSTRRLYISGSPNSLLRFLTPESFVERNLATQTARPKYYTIEAENFVWGPIPDTGYTAKSLHWAANVAMSSDSDAPALFAKHPGLFLYAALIESAPFLGDDPRLLTWASMYDNAVDSLAASDKRDRFPRGGKQMRSRVGPA